jgi:RNA polymerase sigma factor (TIGR02999 family)
MESETPQDVTGLLRAWSQGDEAALERLVPLVDAELRRTARRYLEKESPDPTLQTTALVNEAYLCLIDRKRADWHDRTHFFAVCARIMRHILVDHARAHRSAKRGGGREAVPLEEALAGCLEPSSDLVAIDEALNTLSEVYPRQGQVVELRFFGGLNAEETAEVLGVSPKTVKRDWRFAKSWLMRQLSRQEPHVPGTMATG